MAFFKSKREKASDTPDRTVKKEALSLPRKKIVQFESESKNISELDEMLKNDLRNTLTHALPPANYYRDKKNWLNCELYFDDEYTTVYARIVLLVNDHSSGSTYFYKLDYKLLRDLLRRFGQYI